MSPASSWLNRDPSGVSSGHSTKMLKGYPEGDRVVDAESTQEPDPSPAHPVTTWYSRGLVVAERAPIGGRQVGLAGRPGERCEVLRAANLARTDVARRATAVRWSVSGSVSDTRHRHKLGPA